MEWERAETLARVAREVQQLGGDAREIEAAAGEYPPCIKTPVDRYDGHNNEPSGHGVACPDPLSVEHPRNDTVPGEYDPPRPPPDPPPHTHAEPFANDVTSGEYHSPPICNKARTSQANPIGIHSDKHDEEHDERALVLIITDAVEPLNDGSRGAAAPPPRTPPHESPADDAIPGRPSPLPSESNHPRFSTPSYPRRKSKPPSRIQQRETQT